MGVEETLQAEADRLEGELERLPTYRKLKAVRELLALYVKPSTEPSAGRPGAKIGAPVAAILDAAETFFKQRGERATAAEVVSHLHVAGMLPGSDVQTIRTVASYLSSSKDRFNNIRGQGYGLASWRSVDGDSSSPHEERDGDAIPDPSETPTRKEMPG